MLSGDDLLLSTTYPAAVPVARQHPASQSSGHAEHTSLLTGKLIIYKLPEKIPPSSSSSPSNMQQCSLQVSQSLIPTVCLCPEELFHKD